MSGVDTVADRVKRRRFSDTDRAWLADQQDNKCACCDHILEVTFQVDHIIPLRAGGTNDEYNLHVLCPNCHARKTQGEPEKLKMIAEFPHKSYRYCWLCDEIYSNFFRHRCEKEMWFLKKKERKRKNKFF